MNADSFSYLLATFTLKTSVCMSRVKPVNHGASGEFTKKLALPSPGVCVCDCFSELYCDRLWIYY